MPTPEYAHYVFGSTSGEMPRTAVSQALVVTGEKNRCGGQMAHNLGKETYENTN